MAVVPREVVAQEVVVAELVTAMASVHLPSLVSAPDRLTAREWESFRRGFARLRARLDETRVDTVVVISDEHFNVLDPDCYPTFGVVSAPGARGPVESWFGPARGSIEVAFVPELAELVLARGVAAGFDLTRIGATELEHGFLTCLHFLTPGWDLDYLWLIQNCVLPPLPSVGRCHDFGRLVAEAIRAWESPRRVAVLGTGGLSHAVGTPQAGIIDEAFDARVLALLAENGPELTEITDAEMDAAGNGAHEIRNWVAAAGSAAGSRGELVMYEPVAGCGSGMMIWNAA